MGIIQPALANFIHWYNKYKNKECTKEYARQMVCFKHTTWYKLCRDYENGVDISKYFSRR